MLYNFHKNKVYHRAPNCIELALKRSFVTPLSVVLCRLL